MNYLCRKVDNCFSDSQTWEYKLPVSGEFFASILTDGWSLRLNTRLRRPVFIAEHDKLKIKGVLDEQTIRVSFPNDGLEESKHDFEAWLKEKDV